LYRPGEGARRNRVGGRALDVHARHHNQHRPHQARGQLPPLTSQHPAPVSNLAAALSQRTPVLSGVVNEYRYTA
jgi:hypothetical protein